MRCLYAHTVIRAAVIYGLISGDRPLHIAVRQARTDAIILLLSQGADTSAINNVHQTAAEVRTQLHGSQLDQMTTQSASLSERGRFIAVLFLLLIKLFA